MSDLFTGVGHALDLKAVALSKAGALGRLSQDSPVRYESCCRLVATALHKSGTKLVWEEVRAGVREAYDELNLRDDGLPKREDAHD